MAYRLPTKSLAVTAGKRWAGNVGALRETFGAAHFPRLPEILREHGFDLRGENMVDRQHHDFEVEPERTVVEIGAADRGGHVVDQDDLLMQESRPVAEDAHAGSNQIVRAKLRRLEHDVMVAPARNHQGSAMCCRRGSATRRVRLSSSERGQRVSTFRIRNV